MNNLINREALAEFVQSDEDMLADLASIFADLMPECIGQMERAVANDDSNTLREVAHQAKSRYAYFFCSPLVDIASELEKLASDNELDGTDDMLEQLRTGTIGLVEELASITGLPLEMAKQEATIPAIANE